MSKSLALLAVVSATVVVAAVGASRVWRRRCVVGEAPDLKGLSPVANKVDLERYMSTWYEHRRDSKTPFERDLTNVTAKYKLLPSGFVQVTNSGRDGRGRTKIGRAEARLTLTNGVFLVSFAPFVEAEYVILHLEEGTPTDPYTMAVVGSPSRKFLWLLTRTPQPPTPAQLATFEAIAIKNGYPIEQVRRSQIVKQNP